MPSEKISLPKNMTSYYYSMVPFLIPLVVGASSYTLPENLAKNVNVSETRDPKCKQNRNTLVEELIIQYAWFWIFLFQFYSTSSSLRMKIAVPPIGGPCSRLHPGWRGQQTRFKIHSCNSSLTWPTMLRWHIPHFQLKSHFKIWTLMMVRFMAPVTHHRSARIGVEKKSDLAPQDLDLAVFVSCDIKFLIFTGFKVDQFIFDSSSGIVFWRGWREGFIFYQSKLSSSWFNPQLLYLHRQSFGSGRLPIAAGFHFFQDQRPIIDCS